MLEHIHDQNIWDTLREKRPAHCSLWHGKWGRSNFFRPGEIPNQGYPP